MARRLPKADGVRSGIVEYGLVRHSLVEALRRRAGCCERMSATRIPSSSAPRSTSASRRTARARSVTRASTREVTYVFGAKLPPGGTCPSTKAELARLERREEPVICLRGGGLHGLRVPPPRAQVAGGRSPRRGARPRSAPVTGRPPRRRSGGASGASGADPIVMVTAYDEPSARLCDAAGVDLLLVGRLGRQHGPRLPRHAARNDRRHGAAHRRRRSCDTVGAHRRGPAVDELPHGRRRRGAATLRRSCARARAA